MCQESESPRLQLDVETCNPAWDSGHPMALNSGPKPGLWGTPTLIPHPYWGQMFCHARYHNVTQQKKAVMLSWLRCKLGPGNLPRAEMFWGNCPKHVNVWGIGRANQNAWRGNLWGKLLEGMFGELSQRNYPGETPVGCPDPHAGLQVSTSSGYDLCHPG